MFEEVTAEIVFVGIGVYRVATNSVTAGIPDGFHAGDEEGARGFGTTNADDVAFFDTFATAEGVID